jgi:hypothetical protein
VTLLDSSSSSFSVVKGFTADGKKKSSVNDLAALCEIIFPSSS